ncbi:MAG: alkaline phosphatase, partial [Thermoanaerobaculia bacterium]|nr:alkaline phosphatase [Thermoanaerobaculia bacterium]
DLDAPPPERLLGLFANDDLAFRLDDMRYPEERRDPSLARLTELALEVLTGTGEPFFLVVEGGRIDHASHSFDAATTAHELAEFHEAARVVLELRRVRPELLVLVTADHGTGGLAINDYVDWEALRRQRASVQWMAEQIRNADGDVDMVRAMTGFDDLEESDLEAVREEFDKYEAWRTLGRLLAERNGVTWIPRVTLDTKGHTGEDVPIYAGGPGAERFGGVIDNTDIAAALFDLVGRGARGDEGEATR